MSKKFTMLLMSLLAFVGVAKAGVTDLPEMSTTESIKWYTIKNTRSGKFVTYAGDRVKMTQQATASANSFFYFTASEGEAVEGFTGVMIHNYGTSNLLSDFESWTEAGKAWYLAQDAVNGTPAGFHITNATNLTGWNAWNDYNQSEIGSYYPKDAGGVFEISLVTDFSAIINVPAAKEAAKTTLNALKNITALFSATDIENAIAKVENVEPASNGLADLNAAIAAIDAVVAETYTLVDGKNVRFTSYGRDTNVGHDLTAVTAGANGTKSSADAGIWTLKDNGDGTFKMYNFISDLYLKGTTGGSQRVATSSAFADAAPYTFNPIAENKTNLWNKGNTLHLDGSANVVQWNPDNTTAPASIWTVVSCGPIVIERNQYVAAAAAKEALPHAIQEAYGLVKDAAKYTSNAPETQPAENSSYSNLLDNNYETYFHSSWSYAAGDYHYLQAEVSEEVESFYFYFKKRKQNENNRPTEIEILGSTDGQNFTIPVATITEGLPTNASVIDYFSAKISVTEKVKHLRFVVKSTNNNAKDTENGHPFFTFSEFYILPATPDVTTLVDSYNTFATSSITSETMATAATALINAETTLALANIKKEANALLTANVSNHAATPELGQYPDAAYEALQNAYENGTTEAEIRTAIDNFKKSLNKPVYFISSAYNTGYPAGSAIYYDGADWRWKKANKFDRQMWMTIPGYTNEDVPAVDAYDASNPSYGICDYLTGTKMRGKDVQIVAIPGWGKAFNLQYNADGTSTDAAQHADQYNKIVNWKAATMNDCQASAWQVEYIGNTYDLDQLTPERLEALTALQAAYDEKVHLYWADFGDGLGQYQGDEDAIMTLIGKSVGLLGVKLNMLTEANCTVTNEYITNLATSLSTQTITINQPQSGTYFRIKGANEGAAYYLTGKTIADGSKIVLQETADASTVFYYNEGKLQAVESGLYVGLNSSNFTFQILAKNAPAYTFEGSPRVAGAYNIKSDRYLHYDANGLNCCSSDAGHIAHDWYLEEVTETADIPVNNNILTSLDNLDDNASYRIYGNRGFIYVADDGNMKGTNKVAATYSPVNDKHHFAFVKKGDNLYLYNVGAKKFVMKKDNVVALTDYPEQAVTIVTKDNADQNSGYDWVIKFGGTNRMNLSDSGANGIYTSYETEDDGNVWAICKVGEFNPAEALAVRKVTVTYKLSEQTITKEYIVKKDDTFTLNSYAFATITSCKLGETDLEAGEGGTYSFTVDGDATVTMEIEESLPFVAAKNVSSISSSDWYYLQMHSNDKKYIQYLVDSTYIEWADAVLDEERKDSLDTYSWAFVGNIVEGFKIVNYAATKDSAVVSTGNGNPDMAAFAAGTAFVVVPTTETSEAAEGGFCMQYPNGSYLNAQSGKVAHWNSTDAGSTFVATQSPIALSADLTNLIAYAETVETIESLSDEVKTALTTAIEAAKTTVLITYAEVNNQLTALNTAIDNAIKSVVDARLFRLKNIVSGFYMTIVTPEAAAGIQIKAKDSDATKQAFYIESTAEVGVYNIKSTENYFMASSGSWDYGAYQTANEAGRAHKVEYLGEGKYALKTLLGYAGPNSGETADGSPLFSNHGAGNSGREWELEEVTRSSITYIYKWNDQTLASEVHENVYEGLAAPATAVTLPFGFSYDNAALPTTKGAGNEEVEIACTLSLPFQYAATYQAIEENGYWYYLKFDSDNNYYLHHADGQDHIALDSKAVDKKNKDVYSWGFVGDPVNGYKIVNKAAGNTMILSSSTTMEGETGAGTWPIMTVEEGLPTGNNTLWIPTASTHAANGFFLAQKGFPNNRLNNRGKLAYWTGGAGTGSTFVVEARPFGPAAELEVLLIEAEELKEVVDANTSDKIGEYSSETATALATAIKTAKAVTEATAEDVAALQAVLDNTKIILPTPGQYYQIHSSYFSTTMAVYSNGSNAMWKALNGADKSFYWKAVATEDGIALMNAADDKYLQSGWSIAADAKNIAVKILAKTDAEGAAYEKGYRYGIFMNDGQMHANGHGEGSGTSGNLVNYGGDANSASSWYIVEAELPTFYTITYNFNYEGDTKYTQSVELALGAEFPDFSVSLPYGVSVADEKPAGTVNANQTINIVLTIDKALPFETTTDVDSEDTKWYYMQMHVFDKSYMKYIQDCETYIEWNDLAVADNEIDSHLWCFVGDLWNGVKVVNKATKKAIVSTDGVASMGTEGTAFMPTASDNTGHPTYFCLQNPNSKYLNAQKAENEEVGKVKHWTDNDNGSTFFVTEAGKEYSITIGEVGYSTYYSDYRLAIPTTIEAYVVTSVENREVVLEKVTGVLPAHTGVILRGKGDYSFVTSAAAAAEIETNLLKGTTTKTLIAYPEGKTCYVLANGTSGVGLYIASLNKDENGDAGNTHFYNNANKVYLPVENPVVEEESGQSARALRFRFGGEGTTEIEPSTLNSQPSTIIYDLTGRRINEIVEKGIYIVNGKKVIVK